VRLVRTQKFGREAQIGNDVMEIRSAAEHDSTGWLKKTQTNPTPPPADRVLFATSKYVLHAMLSTTTNLPNSWTLPSADPFARFGGMDTVASSSSRTSRATRQTVLEQKTKRYAEYDPTPRRRDGARCAVARHAASACQPFGGEPGSCLAALGFTRVNTQQ